MGKRDLSEKESNFPHKMQIEDQEISSSDSVSCHYGINICKINKQANLFLYFTNNKLKAQRNTNQ